MRMVKYLSSLLILSLIFLPYTAVAGYHSAVCQKAAAEGAPILSIEPFTVDMLSTCGQDIDDKIYHPAMYSSLYTPLGCKRAFSSLQPTVTPCSGRGALLSLRI